MSVFVPVAAATHTLPFHAIDFNKVAPVYTTLVHPPTVVGFVEYAKVVPPTAIHKDPFQAIPDPIEPNIVAPKPVQLIPLKL